jgi:hypothetical protein
MAQLAVAFVGVGLEEVDHVTRNRNVSSGQDEVVTKYGITWSASAGGRRRKYRAPHAGQEDKWVNPSPSAV